MSSPPLHVGVIGTGEMGRPLVERVHHAGHRVVAYARRPEARAELAALGIGVAESPREAAADRDLVVLYVYTDDQVRDVAIDDGVIDAMRPGSVLVVHTTGNPRTVELLASHARPRGVGVVDAAGSGGPAQVADGTLTLMVGGDDTDIARCDPLFACYAGNVFRVGPLGAGQRVKLINNLLFGAHIQLALDACNLGRSFGIDPAELARVIHHGSGASAALDLVAAMGSPETLLAAAGRFVHKDVLVARATAADLDAPLGTIENVTDPLLDATRPTDDHDTPPPRSTT